MQKVKKINDTYQLVTVPNSYNGIENIEFGYQNRIDLHSKDGFLTVLEPLLNENEVIDYSLEKGIINEKKGTFTYGKKEIVKEPIETQLESLRTEYSYKISEIIGMREAIERNIIDNTPIPNEILEQRELLKKEYNNKVNEINKSNI